jgi:uncharacterized membrane protein
MKSLQLENKSAQRIYNDYIARCNKSLKILSPADKEECLLEINSYIYEYLEANKGNGKDEIENLLNILERLGVPEETFRELIASKKMNQAIRTLNPKALVQALFLNIGNGFIYILLSLLFLIEVCFVVLIVLKLIYPNRVGVFVGSHSFAIGFSNTQPGVTEMVGNWFIPAAMIATAILYFFSLFILKTQKKINNI